MLTQRHNHTNQTYSRRGCASKKNSFTLFCRTTLSGCVITSLPSEIVGGMLNTSTTTLIKGYKIPLYQHTDSDQYPENIV